MPRSTTKKIQLFFLIILTASYSADAAEIRMKAKVQSRGSLVLLGDIAGYCFQRLSQLNDLCHFHGYFVHGPGSKYNIHF